MQKMVAIFGDEMLRGVEISGYATDIYCWPGAEIDHTTSHQVFRTVDGLSERCHSVCVILHFGTHNLGTENLSKRQTPAVYVEELIALVNKLRNIPRCFVTVSSILPRFEPEVATAVVQANLRLKRLLKNLGQNVKFVGTHSPFLEKGRIRTEFYEPDRLHLNEKGTVIFSNRLAIAVRHMKFLSGA